MIDVSPITYNVSGISFEVSISKNYFDKIYEYMLKNNANELSTTNYHFEKKIYYIVEDDEFFNKLELLKNNEHYEIKEYFRKMFCYRYYIKDSIYILEENKDWIIEITKSDYIIYVRAEDLLMDVYLLRFLRSIAYGINEDQKMILMHGAALEYSDKGIVILGEKGSGKTTLLIKFLENGSNIISNDRIFVTEDLNIIGFPQALRVGIETFINEEKITSYFNENTFFRIQDEGNSNFKYLIVFNEIQNIFGAKYKSFQHLKCVIIPEIQIGKECVEIIQLSELEKKDILERVCFTPIDESFRYDWIYFSKLNTLDKIENRDIILKKLESTKFIKVKYGTNATSVEIIKQINNYISLLQ